MAQTRSQKSEGHMTKHKTWATAVIAMAATAFLFGSGGAANSQEPRLPQLTVDKLNDQQKPLADYILKFSAVGIGGPYNMLLRSPAAGKPVLDTLDYLRWHTSVPLRLNEFAILIQSRLWRSQVEWYAHYPLALRAGLAKDTADALKAQKRPAAMQPDEAAVYDFCMALYTKHEVSDAAYAELRKYFSEQQVVDLMLVSGTYANLAGMLAVQQHGLPPGAEPPFKPGEP
jgi:4-carboxymuconolactone decarboxylase